MQKAFLVSIAIFACHAARVEAGLVRYNFSGHITGSSFGSHHVGDLVQGYLTYYNDLKGTNVYTDTTTYYATATQPITISFATGGETITLTEENTAAAESITNNYQYVLGVSVKKGVNQDDPFLRIRFDKSGDYGSRDLPPTLSLSDYAGIELGYFHGDSLFAEIDTLQAVPEPSSLALTATSLLGIAVLLNRGRFRVKS